MEPMVHADRKTRVVLVEAGAQCYPPISGGKLWAGIHGGQWISLGLGWGEGEGGEERPVQPHLGGAEEEAS